MLELWTCSEIFWTSITPSKCKRLYRIMQKSIRTIIRANGKWINY